MNLNKFYKRIAVVALTFLIAFSIFPQQTKSVDSIPPIPVSDAVIRSKEAGITVLGYTVPGLSWDSILITVAKITIERMVDSTVQWINSGFDGNPAYITNPNQYFTDLADGIAGSFIESDERLGFLCSPFQAQIKLALKQQFHKPNPFQCTLTDVVENIEAFYDDFSQGGWDAWFSMTQNSSNNPYGAYLEAKLELDSRLASAIGLKNKELDWGRGFLSFQKCVGQRLGDSYNGPEHNNGCLGRWETVTPGSMIESQLSTTLGTGIRQLELADEFDEIVGALIGQLLQKTIFNSSGGLAGASSVSSTAPGGSPRRNVYIDADGDYIHDGTDTDGDGEIDICLFGGADGETIGPPCLLSSQVEGPPPGWGEGGQCDATGNQYASALMAAMNEVINENPEVANLPNTEINGQKPNGRTFMDLVEEKLLSMGYQAASDVLNGNNNPNTGDAMAIWKDGDPVMERYDTLSGGGATNKDAIQTLFTGFIPLNCTSAGGGTDCGCKSNSSDGGDDGEVPPNTPENPTPGTPFISSVTPQSVQPGGYITITGHELTFQVQFFDGGGNRETVVGTLSADKKQVRAQVPTNQAIGNATVKVYKDANTVSNGKLIQISTTGGSGTVSTVTPTSRWSPPQTSNGWWPALSPDGKYVTYGNWGENWVTELVPIGGISSDTKRTWDFANPPGFDASNGGRCRAGEWISTTTLSFVCELTDNGAMSRYEVKVGEWVAKKTNDDPYIVQGNWVIAEDGHWASFLAAKPTRLAKDNQVVATGVGGAIAISGNTLVHACTNENQNICVRNGLSLSRTYPVRTPLHNMDTLNGYIAYGGYGPVRGITPSGSDIDLTVSPWRWENTAKLLVVNGTMWVGTTSFDNQSGKSYIFLRPWGSKSVIAIEVPATNISYVIRGSDFVITYNDDKGRMEVITVPTNSPRTVLY